MAQLSAAIDGIAEACTALGTPITGGNVSLYNETKGEGIYPTPVVGVVGLLDDVSKAVPSGFQRPGDTVLQIFPADTYRQFSDDHGQWVVQCYEALGSSEFAKLCMGEMWGSPAILNVASEAALHKLLAELTRKSLIYSACDVSDGGWAVACARAGFDKKIGISSDWSIGSPEPDDYFEPFIEHASMVIVTCSPESVGQISEMSRAAGLQVEQLGTTTDGSFDVSMDGGYVIRTSISELHGAFANVLPSQLAVEVVTG
jgi:phosphoribosylformylglycinamidine synthase